VSDKKKGGQAPEKAQPRKHVKSWYLTAAELDVLFPHARRLWEEYLETVVHPVTPTDIARAKALQTYLDLLPADDKKEFARAGWPYPLLRDMLMPLFGKAFLETPKKKSDISRWIYPGIDILRRELAGWVLWDILTTCSTPGELEIRLAKCNEQIKTIRIPLDSAIKLAQRLLPSPPEFATLKSGWRNYQQVKDRLTR
jgi:hypothetical protein